MRFFKIAKNKISKGYISLYFYFYLKEKKRWFKTKVILNKEDWICFKVK